MVLLTILSIFMIGASFSGEPLSNFLLTKIFFHGQIFFILALALFFHKKIIKQKILVGVGIFSLILVWLFLRMPGIPEIYTVIVALGLSFQNAVIGLKLSKDISWNKLELNHGWYFLLMNFAPLILMMQVIPENLSSGVHIPSLNIISNPLMVFLIAVCVYLVFLIFIKFPFTIKSFIWTLYALGSSFIAFNWQILQGESFGAIIVASQILFLFLLIPSKKISLVYLIILFFILFLGGSIYYYFWDHWLLDQGLNVGSENVYMNYQLFLNALFYSLHIYVIYIKSLLWVKSDVG